LKNHFGAYFQNLLIIFSKLFGHIQNYEFSNFLEKLSKYFGHIFKILTYSQFLAHLENLKNFGKYWTILNVGEF
jgi:hypothetical protein